MPLLKQALILFKSETRYSLLLGAITLMGALFSNHFSFAGAFLLNVIIFASALQVWYWQTRKQRAPSFEFFRHHAGTIFLLSLLTFPTGILLGTAAGLLQQTDQLMTALPQAFFLIFVCLMLYWSTAQSLIFKVKNLESISKSLDHALKYISKNLLQTCGLLMIVAIVSIPAFYFMGLGLILMAPIFYYLIYYSTKTE